MLPPLRYFMTLIIDEYNGMVLEEDEEGHFVLSKHPDFPLEEIAASELVKGEDSKMHTIGTIMKSLEREISLRHRLIKNYTSSPNPNTSFELDRILWETVINAEMHGNNYHTNKRTFIDYSFSKDKSSGIFKLSVKDEGDGFDYSHVVKSVKSSKTGSYNDSRKEGEQSKSSGRGIYGLINYCDSVSWEDNGRRINIIKKLKI